MRAGAVYHSAFSTALSPSCPRRYSRWAVRWELRQVTNVPRKHSETTAEWRGVLSDLGGPGFGWYWLGKKSKCFVSEPNLPPLTIPENPHRLRKVPNTIKESCLQRASATRTSQEGARCLVQGLLAGASLRRPMIAVSYGNRGGSLLRHVLGTLQAGKGSHTLEPNTIGQLTSSENCPWMPVTARN